MIIAPNFCISAKAQSPEWTYDEDNTGQEDWGAITGYEICRDGTNQSPVNITYTKTSNLPPLNFKYNQANVTLKLNRQSFIMNAADGGTIVDGDKSYILQSIEIHSPSAHRVRDTFYPAEIHLIHKNTSGDLLIVAVFVNIGADNPAIEEMLKYVASNNPNSFIFKSGELLPKSYAYYAYNGSIPYPPCTENVQWRVIKTPITISSQQLGGITRYTGRNTRLPQPVYMRDVLESE